MKDSLNTSEREQELMARLDNLEGCEDNPVYATEIQRIRKELASIQTQSKKWYADIFHAKSNTHITIGEYSEKEIEKSIQACIKQRGFDTSDCTWQIHTEEI